MDIVNKGAATFKQLQPLLTTYNINTFTSYQSKFSSPSSNTSYSGANLGSPS